MSVDQSNAYSSTKFITGMRGYSALAVFLIHSGGGGLRELCRFTNLIVDYGKYGFIPFFVISAFTIAMSIDNSRIKRTYAYKNYLINRFLRIFPFLFVVLFFAFLTGGREYYLHMFNIKNNFANFLAQISLLNIFFVKHRNNLVGVEWTVSIEFLYYLLFPGLFCLLLKLRESKAKLSLIMLLSFLISVFSKNIIAPFYTNTFLAWLSHVPSGSFISNEIFNPSFKDISNYWGALRYLFAFSTGMILYILYKKTAAGNHAAQTISGRRNNRLFISVFSIGFIFILMQAYGVVLHVGDDKAANFVTFARTFLIVSNPNAGFLVTIWTCALVYSCFYRGLPVRLIFENPLIIYLGNISYSFYLTHYIILSYLRGLPLALKFFAGLIITILVSTATYYLIEKPFINLGHRLKTGVSYAKS